ncbi:MAG: hypothetical protein Q8L23_00640 [Caulobacter sp.]|nr:hypothetical protein [Caulobacter sp.]
MQTATIFNHETVVLDGEAFADCEFRDCRMVYSGGKPPVFDSCRFDNCDWRFDDAAARTLAHLKVVWAAGGKAQVQALIKEITVSSGR